MLSTVYVTDFFNSIYLSDFLWISKKKFTTTSALRESTSLDAAITVSEQLTVIILVMDIVFIFLSVM